MLCKWLMLQFGRITTPMVHSCLTTFNIKTFEDQTRSITKLCSDPTLHADFVIASYHQTQNRSMLLAEQTTILPVYWKATDWHPPKARMGSSNPVTRKGIKQIQKMNGWRFIRSKKTQPQQKQHLMSTL